MNFEPMQDKEARKEARGTTQVGTRLYNERLALSLIRQYGQLPKAEIARLTGLSAQTVSVIVRQLERDGLVIKGDKLRGKVGQPLVPFKLNPDGAFSIGLKVGRRSGDLILLDLAGKVRKIVRQPYHFPTPEEFLAFAKAGISKLLADLPKALHSRISGLGIASPFELWNWEEEVGAPHDVLEAWRNFDLATEIAKLGKWPVLFCNDASAACAAEIFFGHGRTYRDFAYFYVGFFVGGGIVLNGSLYQGRTGSAGAIGSLPVPSDSGSEQLIRHASLYLLERRLIRQGHDELILTQNPNNWSGLGLDLDQWIEDTGKNLAHAALSAAGLIDFEAIIIDGAMPSDIRQQVVAATDRHFSKLDRRGTAPLSIMEGSIGADARAMGGAALSLMANFVIDRDVLFKEAT
ncbi:MAG: ROK family transcriptional regulator [Aestuariivirga sp.]